MVLTLCFVASADQAADRTAIEKAIESYMMAFNAQDPSALAAHWSSEAIYTNLLTGEQFEGRDAIAAQFAEQFAGLAGAKLVVEINSIDFLSPSVAVEHGTAQLVSKNAAPVISRYSAIHVKSDGKWLLDRVSEDEDLTPPSNYEHLKELEWMIGTWVDEDDQARVETTCQWTKNQAFITRAFTISIGDQIDMSGMQIIGWDASKGKIRSWVFDSDGGFGEATWERKENRWMINSAATLPDGRKASAMHIMTLNDDDTFNWQSTGRELDGEILPNIKPVKVVRSAENSGE